MFGTLKVTSPLPEVAVSCNAGWESWAVTSPLPLSRMTLRAAIRRAVTSPFPELSRSGAVVFRSCASRSPSPAESRKSSCYLLRRSS